MREIDHIAVEYGGAQTCFFFKISLIFGNKNDDNESEREQTEDVKLVCEGNHADQADVRENWE